MVETEKSSITECIRIATFLDSFVQQAKDFYQPLLRSSPSVKLSRLGDFINVINESSTDIRNKHQSYHDDFFDQIILEKFKFIPGLLYFLSKCIFLLHDPINLTTFLNEIGENHITFLSLVNKLQGIDDEPKQVYTLFAYFDHLLLFTGWYAQWISFQQIERIRVERIPSVQRNFFRRVLLQPEFINSYRELIEDLDESTYQTAIDTALLRTCIVDPIIGQMNGFTTANLFIFIQESYGITENLCSCGNFIKLVHELGHYLRRCKSRFIGDCKQISTPQNSEFSSSEGGTIAIKKIFGGEVKFIPRGAADFFMSEVFNLEQFKDMILVGEKDIPSGEVGLIIKWKGYENGCVSRLAF